MASDLARKAKARFDRMRKGMRVGTASDRWQQMVWGFIESLTDAEARAVESAMTPEEIKYASYQSTYADNPKSSPELLRRERVGWHFSMNPDWKPSKSGRAAGSQASWTRYSGFQVAPVRGWPDRKAPELECPKCTGTRVVLARVAKPGEKRIHASCTVCGHKGFHDGFAKGRSASMSKVKQVTLISGARGWRAKLRDNYDGDYNLWKRYAEMYGLHGKLGYKSPNAAWVDNPIIEGSVDPADYKRSKGRAKGRAQSGGWSTVGQAPHGRGEVSHYYVETSRLGPSAVAINKAGRVVNVINGDSKETLESVLRAAKKYWPSAKLIQRPEFALRGGTGTPGTARTVAVGRRMPQRGLAMGSRVRGCLGLGLNGRGLGRARGRRGRAEGQEVTMTDFLQKHGITMTCERISERSDSGIGDAAWNRAASHFKCKFRKGARGFTVEYSQGSGWHGAMPKAANVFDSLVSDASGYDSSRNFEDWASDFGMDTRDPLERRRHMRTYNAVKRIREKLASLLGPAAYNELGNVERL